MKNYVTDCGGGCGADGDVGCLNDTSTNLFDALILFAVVGCHSMVVDEKYRV